jgi:16S rRNA (guanine(966)-N(2))-methyltransferase RsmD
MIQPYLPNSRTLDLFAGSGALGVEALSRGAQCCDFVEQNRAAAEFVRENLRKTRLGGGEVFVGAAREFLEGCQKQYDVVFLDPPYHKGLCELSLELLEQRRLLATGAVVVCETSEDETPSAALRKIKESKYGAVKITLFTAD